MITTYLTVANNGNLAQVPDRLLTLETLLVKNVTGFTPLHWAACRGYLDRVSESLLTLESLLVKDTPGFTPLHWAAWREHLDQLLGIDFGENKEVKEIVGEEWLAKNRGVLRQKKELGPYEAPEVDLF